jgi:hypothetical protein
VGVVVGAEPVQVDDRRRVAVAVPLKLSLEQIQVVVQLQAVPELRQRVGPCAGTQGATGPVELGLMLAELAEQQREPFGNLEPGVKLLGMERADHEVISAAAHRREQRLAIIRIDDGDQVAERRRSPLANAPIQVEPVQGWECQRRQDDRRAVGHDPVPGLRAVGRDRAAVAESLDGSASGVARGWFLVGDQDQH